jgi:hypothetical protein
MKNKLLTLLASIAIFATSLSAQTIVGERSISAMYSNLNDYELVSYDRDDSLDCDQKADTFGLYANVPVASWADIGGYYSYEDASLNLPLFPSVVDIDLERQEHTVGVFGSFYFPRTNQPVDEQPCYTERNLWTPYITVGGGHVFSSVDQTVTDLWYNDSDPFRSSESYSSWFVFEQIGVVIGNDCFQVNPYFRYNFLEGSTNDTYKVGVDADVTIGSVALFVGYARGFSESYVEDIHSQWNDVHAGIRVLF